MNEWASESNKELDFFCEAKNLVRINTAMKRSGLDVIVPELVPEFTRTKASDSQEGGGAGGREERSESWKYMGVLRR